MNERRKRLRETITGRLVNDRHLSIVESPERIYRDALKRMLDADFSKIEERIVDFYRETQNMIETRIQMTCRRVLVDADGTAHAPDRTEITPDVIYVRADGWSLGCSVALSRVALNMWPWVEKWERLADNTWMRTWPIA